MSIRMQTILNHALKSPIHRLIGGHGTRTVLHAILWYAGLKTVLFSLLRYPGMGWSQRTVRLRPRSRGFHLITDEVVTALPELGDCRIGVLHVFIQHTSASLTINENAD